MSDNNNKTTVTSRGIGFTGLLTIVLIVLKLCGVIDWAWLIVLSPIIISTVLGILLLFICLVIYAVSVILEYLLK